MRFVVTGLGRSGTKYMSKLLRATGIQCTHEGVFSLKAVEANPLKITGSGGDSSWLAAPFLRLLPQHTTVLHQVRNPIDTAASWVARDRSDQNPYTRFAARYCGFDYFSLEPTLRAARLWVAWNAMIESTASTHKYIRYRIEDVDTKFIVAVSALVGSPCSKPAAARALRSVPGGVNHRSDTKTSRIYNHSKLLEPAARQYGYSL